VGYGKGYFLDAAEEIIPECYGYDVADNSVPDGCTKISEDQFLKGQFDVVCFWDALEHFDNLEFIKDLQCEMICVSLPWCHYREKLYDEGIELASQWFDKWKHRKPDEHLWHFDGLALTDFMNRMGYESVHIPFNIEDATRKGAGSPQVPNILTGSFRKK
jgi:hypothetical protein